MASLKTKSERNKNDAYYTPDEVAEKCVDALFSIYPPGENFSVLEPSVGGGSFIQALWKQEEKRDISLRIDAIDVDPAASGLGLTDSLGCAIDFLSTEPIIYDGADIDEYDYIVGNPPFNKAIEFIEHALKRALVVGFLLRLGFLASKKRQPFFDRYPPAHVFVLSERPSFTCDGKTDGCDYAFMVWDRETLSPIKWI